MIAVVDYGMGNLRSVSKALETLKGSVRVTSDPHDVARAGKIILPGVGAFDAAVRELTARKLVEPIKQAIAAGKPYLGICLGLQLLFESSEEGRAPGFGVLRGTVKRFNAQPGLKIPHMGWNEAAGAYERSPLLRGVAPSSYFYFVHSYYAAPADTSMVVLETDYGVRFPSMLSRDRLFATQFHPEKSQTVGLKLLENFLAL